MTQDIVERLTATADEFAGRGDDCGRLARMALEATASLRAQVAALTDTRIDEIMMEQQGPLAREWFTRFARAIESELRAPQPKEPT